MFNYVQRAPLTHNIIIHDQDLKDLNGKIFGNFSVREREEYRSYSGNDTIMRYYIHVHIGGVYMGTTGPSFTCNTVVKSKDWESRVLTILKSYIKRNKERVEALERETQYNKDLESKHTLMFEAIQRG